MKKTFAFLLLVLLASPLWALDIYEPLAQDSLWVTTKGSAPFTSNPTTTLFGRADYAINNSVLIGAFGQANYNNGITRREAGATGVANVTSFADNKALVDLTGSMSYNATSAAWNYALGTQLRGILEGGLMPYGQLSFNSSSAAGTPVAFNALAGSSLLLTEQVEAIANLSLDFGGSNVNPVLSLNAGSNWLLSDLLQFQVDLTAPLANAGSNLTGSFALYAGI